MRKTFLTIAGIALLALIMSAFYVLVETFKGMPNTMKGEKSNG